MIKKIIAFLTLLFIFPFFVFAKEFDTTSEYIILYNMNDDTVLYEENSLEKVSIASLTKMMTAIVAIENIDDLDAKITLTNKDFLGVEGYSKAGFNVGDVITYKDALYGILLPSGAEAVQTVANNVSGDISSFVDLMNEECKKIGLENTHFSNPIGKDDVDNYSTPSDVAKLLKYALKNETFKEIFTTRTFTTTNGKKLESTLINYGSLFDISPIKGSKSGFTKEAGRCLASISEINGVKYLLVVIKSSTSANYNAVKDSLTIYNYYSSNYGYKDIIDEGTVVKKLPIEFATTKEYEIKSTDTISKYIKNDSNIRYEFDGIDKLTNKIHNGDKLGVINIYNNDDLIYTMDIYLNESIHYLHPYLYGGIFLLVLILILVVIRIKNKKKRRHRKRR